MTSPIETVLAALESSGCSPVQRGDEWQSRCPSHEDEKPSLSVAVGDDRRVLVRCFAGCEFERIASALGLLPSAFFTVRADGRRRQKDLDGYSLTKEWKIRDGHGVVVALHRRFDNPDGQKKCLWHFPDGTPSRRPTKDRPNARHIETRGLPLYGVHDLPASGAVVVVEGEKAADALRERRIAAVGTVTGAAGTPAPSAFGPLAGREVVLWPDFDDVGRAHMERVGAAAVAVAASVRVVHWSGATQNGDDAADFFARGGTLEELRVLFETATPFGSLATEAPKSGATTEGARAVVCIHAGKEAALVAESEKFLPAVGIYQRAGQLVRVVQDAALPGDGAVRRIRGAPVILAVVVDWLRVELSRIVEFRKFDKRSEDWVPTNCPEWLARALLARRGDWPVPPLAGATEIPPLRADGTLRMEDGYDEATAFLYQSGTIAPSAVPIGTTQDDARAALARLLDLVSNFPFAGPAHATAWVAMLLSLCARHLFHLCPAFMLGAPKRGSGKTLLAKIASLVVTGRFPPVFIPAKEDDENRKRWATIALEGDPFVVVDNVVGSFGCPAFDAAATSGTVKDRRLGLNESLEAPFRAVVAITGNNVTLRGDAVRRIIPSFLLPNVERPWETPSATFKRPKLLRHVVANRAQLLGDALTILSVYLRAGRPAQTVRPLGAFDDWLEVVPAAIVYANGADPVEACAAIVDEACSTDGEAGEVLAAIREAVGDDDFSVPEIVDKARERPTLSMILRATAAARSGDGIDPKALGRRFLQIKDGVYGGLRIVAVMRLGARVHRARAALWRVEAVFPALAVLLDEAKTGEPPAPWSPMSPSARTNAENCQATLPVESFEVEAGTKATMTTKAPSRFACDGHEAD